jgi:hypothetical protein
VLAAEEDAGWPGPATWEEGGLSPDGGITIEGASVLLGAAVLALIGVGAIAVRVRRKKASTGTLGVALVLEQIPDNAPGDGLAPMDPVECVVPPAA